MGPRFYRELQALIPSSPAFALLVIMGLLEPPTWMLSLVLALTLIWPLALELQDASDLWGVSVRTVLLCGLWLLMGHLGANTLMCASLIVVTLLVAARRVSVLRRNFTPQEAA